MSDVVRGPGGARTKIERVEPKLCEVCATIRNIPLVVCTRCGQRFCEHLCRVTMDGASCATCAIAIRRGRP